MQTDLNYYEILEVPVNAESAQIKHAYFKKVRKYPPERFPEEFKKIRTSYEILLDPQSRKQYDERSGDKYIDTLFEKASAAYDNDDFERAVSLAKKILEKMPNFYLAENLIGMSYLCMQEYSSAVTLYRNLIKKSPSNHSYYYNYACALYFTTAYKHAIEILNTALEYDQTDIQTWSILADCYSGRKEYSKAREILQKCIAVCGGTVSIYLKLIRIDILIKNSVYIKNDIDELERFAENNPEMCENVAWSLSEIAEDILHFMPSYSEEIVNRARRLLPEDDEELISLHEEAKREMILKEQYETISKDHLVHPWIKDLIHDIFFTEISFFPEDEYTIIQRIILRFPTNFLSSLHRIKAEYPIIYRELSSFFGKILDNPDGYKIDEAKLIRDINSHPASSPENRINSIDEIFVPNIQIVNTNKTGRNDPCPCGSGKKYKKCCLA